MVRRLVPWVALACIGACGRIGYDAVGDAGDGLRLTPPAATVNLSSSVSFAASGGTPPYQFSVEGPGAFDGAGTFFAPARAGASIVVVTDDVGAQAGAEVHYQGSRLYCLGGEVGGNPIDGVLVSDDGGASWQPAGQLPAPRDSGAAVVFHDRIYYLGGTDAGGASTDTAWWSQDGAVWNPAGALPAPVTSAAATVHRGDLWLLGGWHAGNHDTVHRSPDGATWVPLPPLPSGRHELDAISRGDRLYLIGGHDDGGYLDQVVSTTDGAAWSPEPGTLRIAIDFGSSGELGDRVFHGAGSGSVAMETSLDLSAWVNVAPLPGSPREGPALVGFGGNLLVIGGAAPVLATVDGSGWTPIGGLPDGRARVAVVQFTPP